MGWFSNKPPEPKVGEPGYVYPNPVAEKLVYYLTEERGLWALSRTEHMIRHSVTGHEVGLGQYCVNGHSILYQQPVDVREHVLRLGRVIHSELIDALVVSSPVLEPFDREAVALAKAVLDGDLVAARALVDKIAEIINDAPSPSE